MRGVAGVKLVTVSAGGTLCTSENNLKEFFAAVAQARQSGTPAPMIRTPARREKDVARARSRLAAAGIK